MEHLVRFLAPAPLLLAALLAGCAASYDTPSTPLACMSRFKVRHFVIGAWCFNDSADFGHPYLAPYKAAGFDTLIHCMVNLPRDKQPPRDDYWSAALAAADREGLHVILHTARPAGPWGHWDGVQLPPDRGGYAESEDLTWLHGRYGRHPSLIGYLIADDAGVTGSAAVTARWLKTLAPEMIPYVSNVTDPRLQAFTDVPILSRQNYPWDTEKGKTEAQCRTAYAHWLDVDSHADCENRTTLWPIVWASQRGGSPSQLRYQALLPIAYGAQGLFWFAYSPSDPAWRPGGRFYQAARYCNEYLRDVVGPRVLGCRSAGVFSKPQGCVTAMDSDLAVGLLEYEAVTRIRRHVSRAFPPRFAMVVDTRTAPADSPEPPPRTVRVAFGPEVRAVAVCGRDLIGKKNAAPAVVKGNAVSLTLQAGDGILLELIAEH